MGAFNGLISRAAVGSDCCVDGNGDFIVDRNVAGRHLIDVDAVSILPYWRMLLNVGYVRLPVSEQPVIPNVDLGANRNRTRRAAVHNDIAGTRFYFQINGPADLESLLKMSLGCGSGCESGSKQHGESDRKQ